MSDTKLLREHVRNVLGMTKKIQKKNQLQERVELFKLRKFVRSLIKEAEDLVSSKSTGINVLTDLLETIVPILKSYYKKMGTDVQQRKSYRSHIVKSVQNLLSPVSVMYKAGTKGKEEPAAAPAPAVTPSAPLKELDMGLDSAKPAADGVESDPAFIPLEKDKAAQEPKEAKPEDTFVEISGEDATGRNIALQAFKRVEKQIREAYSILANQADRDLFYDFLITNLKLYFDKFEDELQTTVPEPTTSEYEAEKLKKAGSIEAPANEPTPEPEQNPEPEIDQEPAGQQELPTG